MSLQILSQYAGGPRVRATGWPEITTSGSGAAAEPVRAAAVTEEVPTPSAPQTAAQAPATSAEATEPAQEAPAKAQENPAPAAAGGAGGGITLGRRAPRAPGGGGSTLHGSRIREVDGGTPAAPGASVEPAAESSDEPAAAPAPSAPAVTSGGGLKLGGGSKAKAPGGGSAGKLVLGAPAAAGAAAASGGGDKKDEAPDAPDATPAAQANPAPTTEAGSEPAADDPMSDADSVSTVKKSGSLTLGGGSKAKAPGGGKSGGLTLGGAAATADSSVEAKGHEPTTSTADPAPSATDRPADAPAASQPAAAPPAVEPAVEEPEKPAAAEAQPTEKAPAERIEAAPVPTGPVPPARTVKFVEKFLSRHGGAADVVLQPVGRRGVRLTLVGADGVLGDTMVDSLSQAEAVRDGISGLTGSDWTRELVSRTDVPDGHWKRMAGSGSLV